MMCQTQEYLSQMPEMPFVLSSFILKKIFILAFQFQDQLCHLA